MLDRNLALWFLFIQSALEMAAEEPPTRVFLREESYLGPARCADRMAVPPDICFIREDNL